jgi:hypothetical protein
MLESIVMLRCDVCRELFDKHRLVVGDHLGAWSKSARRLRQMAREGDWSFVPQSKSYLCPSCVLHGAFWQ